MTAPRSPATSPGGGGAGFRDLRARYRTSRESEARVLLLIDQFSRMATGSARTLEGRVKLAKLDFLLRYPRHLRRVLAGRGVDQRTLDAIDVNEAPLDARMTRYRYGPWDPSYFALLGSLIGRGLVEVVPLGTSTGFGYRTTQRGADLAENLRSDESFAKVVERIKLIRRHLDLSGTKLKNILYELPEISDAAWKEELT